LLLVSRVVPLLLALAGIAGCGDGRSFSATEVEQAFARHDIQLLDIGLLEPNTVLTPANDEPVSIVVFREEAEAARYESDFRNLRDMLRWKQGSAQRLDNLVIFYDRKRAKPSVRARIEDAISELEADR
jgi:hypothetical protein